MYIRSGSNMNYSTLREAYSIDSFEKDKKHKTKKKVKYEVEEFTNEDDVRYETEHNSGDTKSINDTQVSSQQSEQPKPMPNLLHKPVRQEPANIQPYYDEDLEKYLNINDFKSVDTPYIPQSYDVQPNSSRAISPSPTTQMTSVSPVSPVTPVTPVTPTQSTQSMRLTERHVELPQAERATPKDIFYKNIVNIGLFILIGILIIFLCDQITEIAVNIGMKKTVAILEPYLNKQHGISDSSDK